MDLEKTRPIIRHWRWLYGLLDLSEERVYYYEEEKFIEELKDNWGWDKENWLLNIIRSKKLILINDDNKRVKININNLLKDYEKDENVKNAKKYIKKGDISFYLSDLFGWKESCFDELLFKKKER